MRQKIQEILDKIGSDFFGEDITDRLTSDWEIAADELAGLKPAVSCEEYIEITAFLAEKAEGQLKAARAFSQHVADMQAMDQRWLKWIEAARVAGKTDFSLSAWRNEVMGTPRQNEAFVA
jgi:hypothetical protein